MSLIHNTTSVSSDDVFLPLLLFLHVLLSLMEFYDTPDGFLRGLGSGQRQIYGILLF